MANSAGALTLADWERMRTRLPDERRAVVGRLGPQATARFVREICQWGADSYPDHDSEELLFMGIVLSYGRAAAAVEAALTWLEKEPSAARFTAACTVLGGLWAVEDRAVCNDDWTLRLIDAFDLIEPDTAERYVLCTTLLQASRSGQLGPEVLERLRTAVLTNAALLPEALGGLFIERFRH